jgi:hypothetical protein
LLATTSFSAGLLTINLDAINEILTLTNDGSNISITSTAAITGSGSSFATSSVASLSVTDTGSISDQSVNFGVGTAFAFSGGITISGIESVQGNNAISVSGSSQISVTGADTIQTAGSITTAGGAPDLLANADIVITQPILTNDGVQTLTADSDNDGSGSLSLNFAITELLDPHPNAGNQFGSTILVLTSGNVVVTSPYDDAGATDAGAVYLFNGFTGQFISKLKGTTASDRVGFVGVKALTNGNYVVISYYWDNGSVVDAGAVTWGDGTTGVSGNVSATNSAVGNSSNAGNSLFVANNSSNDAFYVSFKSDGSGRVVAGSQSQGFASTSGSLNSGGGAIALQANSASVQTSACTTTANAITITANALDLGTSGSNHSLFRDYPFKGEATLRFPKNEC